MLLEGNVERVSVMGNDLSRAAKAFELGSGVDSAALFLSGNRLKR